MAPRLNGSCPPPTDTFLLARYIWREGIHSEHWKGLSVLASLSPTTLQMLYRPSRSCRSCQRDESVRLVSSLTQCTTPAGYTPLKQQLAWVSLMEGAADPKHSVKMGRF